MEVMRSQNIEREVREKDKIRNAYCIFLLHYEYNCNIAFYTSYSQQTQLTS